MTREKPRQDAINEYRAQLVQRLRSGKLPSAKQWMINRYFQIEKEWAIDLKYNFDLVLNHLHLLTPKATNFRFLRIERDLEPMFMLNEEVVYLEELSSGFQSILSIVFSIIDWIESTGENGNQKIDTATGTVMIDELDAHLHPEWQQIILDSLRSLFPCLQFIITTHSPHIALTCKPNELIIIPNHNGFVDIYPSENSYRGWAIENLLTSLMGLEDTRRLEFNDLHSQIENLILAQDEEKFNKAIQNLVKIISPDDPIAQYFQLRFANEKIKSKK